MITPTKAEREALDAILTGVKSGQRISAEYHMMISAIQQRASVGAEMRAVDLGDSPSSTQAIGLSNIERFGRLQDKGQSPDCKRHFITDDGTDSWRRIALELDSDDCDGEHARDFKAALIELWNSQAQ